MKAHKKVFITESDVRREVKRFLFTSIAEMVRSFSRKREVIDNANIR